MRHAAQGRLRDRGVVVLEVLDQPRGEVLAHQSEAARGGHLRVGAVAPSILELVEAANVIEVPMRGDRDDGTAVAERVDRREKRPDPVREVDDEVALRSPYVPDVGLEERIHVRLDQTRHSVAGVLGPEPRVDDRHFRDHARYRKNTAEAGGRRQCSEYRLAL